MDTQQRPVSPPGASSARRRLAGWPLLAWVAGWLAMLLLDGSLDLANLAMVLVLTSAVASLWLPGWASALASALAVAAFNWSFVPPRHEFSVDLHQHALLLLTMLSVNWIISGLVIRQRRQADEARRGADREARLRTWSDTLRQADDPAAHASALHAALADAAQVAVAVSVLQRLDAGPDDESTLQVGETNGDQHAGLALCIRDGRPMGPGTGRYDGQPDLYLPLRGRGITLGAVVLQGVGRQGVDPELRPHLQALCDQMGGALHRSMIARQEQHTRERAQQQGVRNALLAAIAHDYRTPLATIMGAASSLQEQAGRLDAGQRHRLAGAIVDEAERLSRLTDNTLQLARLDSPAFELRRDWESAEEMVGAVLRHARRRPDGHRVKARLEPQLPLLWCDALLVSQLLDNLVDNALKYSPAEATVEILVRRIGNDALLAVRDRGPGIEPGWRERVFEVFQRGDDASRTKTLESSRQGTGVGLAVCRAIAKAHGGHLRLRARAHGGCSFEFVLPLRDPPPSPPADDAA